MNDRSMTLHGVQIVVSLMPGEDGVGDYAYRLACTFPRQGIETTFVVAGHRRLDRTSKATPSRKRFKIIHAENTDPGSLGRTLSSIGADVVVVHMSAYGYADKGVPTWLVDGLAAWKKTSSAPLVTVFHELWQKPILWRKTLVRFAFQRWQMRRLFNLSDAYVTTTEPFGQALRRWDSRKLGAVIPVFSNIDVSDAPLHDDSALAVVFGLRLGRDRTYQRLSHSLQRAAELGIKRIVDIGEGAIVVPEALRNLVKTAGQLDAQDVSRVMGRARYGLLCYDANLLGKSGVFNAYAAHGMCVVNLGQRGGSVDGLVEGRHYMSWNGGSIEPDKAAHVGRAAHDWYQGHSLEATTGIIADLVRSVSKRRAPHSAQICRRLGK
jgi:hypothetical protein